MKYKIMPTKIEDLVQAGIIDRVSEDPYGGSFFIMKNGKVYTTGNLLKKNRR